MFSGLPFHGVLLLCLCALSSCSPFEPSQGRNGDRAHGYRRFADVQRQCQPVLSTAVELRYYPEREPFFRRELERKLSFEKGDWRQQDAGHAPLLPFDGSDVATGGRVPPDPLRLATFVLTHVDADRVGPTAVNVSGVLVLSVARESAGDEIRPGARVPAASPEFEILPGSTKLKIPFEGVYTERVEGGGGGDGERVLCMVGSAVIPTRSTNDGAAGSSNWGQVSARTNLRPPVIADNNIVLVIRYPKWHTLTTRAVHGEMWSTNAVSDAAYFDTVRLMSKISAYNMGYQFQSDELVATACSPWPASDAMAVENHSGELHRGISMCEVLNRFATGATTWQCSSKDQPCRWPGPFEAGTAADGAGEALAVALQDVRCHPSSDADGSKYSARVSAVFRALSPREHRLTAVKRTSLDSKTLAVEGVWKATAGQACMVGCLGGGRNACHYRVCLYVPTTFSITRRSIILGRITSISAGGGEEETRPPLLLEQRVPSVRLWGVSDVFPFRMAYNYTKVEQAGEFLRRSGSAFSARDIVAKSLSLSYPKKGTTGDDEVTSLFRLGDELMLRFTALPDLFPSEWTERPALFLEMLSVEQAVGPITPPSFWHGSSMVPGDSGQPDEEPASSVRRSLWNVSAELRIVGKPFGWMTALSLEGVYNPEDGRMFLIGCWDVRLPGRNVSMSRDLEEGMDCSVEVKVEYPPTTTYRLIGSTAKVHITSTRSAGDPLYFGAVKLEALPLMYQKQWRDAGSGGVINGALCIVVLSVAIAASLSQLRYLKSHADVAPYVSDAMLAVQFLGYGLPLITGSEALLEKVTFGSQATKPPPSSSYAAAAGTDDEVYRAIGQMSRALLLAALLLTLRIGHKVRRSRARMLARSPLEPWRVPADRKVLAYSSGAPLAAFSLAVALNGQAMSVEQLVALTQDLFLLPQMIGNAVWRVNCKPLAGSYYLGITAARVLPHAYDYLRPPAVDPYSDQYSNEYSQMSRPVDLVVPLVAIVLALVVYVQQRWNYAIVSRMCKAEQKKLQHIF
ncbi:hypothetical protein PAHAL_2G426000 [Panicum hallii]|jgi:hypothetical protein|uniref:RING-type E3 ubiquitin transferase n=1 Tax=Panicum hallii TaxID=206008 RepID=A0A2S3H3R0_9POAL|nr:uncharacterized protein LOC112881299 [Panicum hallii]PAN14640.1 hypothetical protein PAHAL_2G426000 [Panicum hallii]